MESRREGREVSLNEKKSLEALGALEGGRPGAGRVPVYTVAFYYYLPRMTSAA